MCVCGVWPAWVLPCVHVNPWFSELLCRQCQDDDLSLRFEPRFAAGIVNDMATHIVQPRSISSDKAFLCMLSVFVQAKHLAPAVIWFLPSLMLTQPQLHHEEVRSHPCIAGPSFTVSHSAVFLSDHLGETRLSGSHRITASASGCFPLVCLFLSSLAPNRATSSSRPGASVTLGIALSSMVSPMRFSFSCASPEFGHDKGSQLCHRCYRDVVNVPVFQFGHELDPLFSHFVFEFSQRHPQVEAKVTSASHSPCRKPSLTANGRLPFRCVHPGCWLYLFRFCPQVGKGPFQHRAPSPSRSTEPVLDVARNEDFRWFSSHFRVDLPCNLRCSTFVVDSCTGMTQAPFELARCGLAHR